MKQFIMNRYEAVRSYSVEFLRKDRGKDVDIDVFPFLFTMQGHNGVSGIVFSGAWFIILIFQYRSFWNTGTIFTALLIEIGFLGIIVASNSFGTMIVYRTSDQRRSERDWDFFARFAMTLLLIWFALVCSALIWLTGGMSSPFIPFYIMVFVFALTKCKLPHPGKALLVLYSSTFAVASLAANKWLLPVDPAVVSEINGGPAREWAEFAFSLLAMAVPYWSSRYAEGREEERKQGSTSEPVATQLNP